VWLTGILRERNSGWAGASAREGGKMTISRVLTVVALAAIVTSTRAAEVRFDFRKTGVAGWRALHDVSLLKAAPDGMAITISGGDPYIAGPERNYPASTPLWLSLRLRGPGSGTGQVFWFSAGKGPNELDSIRFPISGGSWNDVRVPLPPLGPGVRLRFDPPGDHGTVTIASIVLSPRATWREPVWPKPAVDIGVTTATLRSGELAVGVNGEAFGAFRVSVQGVRLAVAHCRPLIGYVENGKARWLDVRGIAKAQVMKAPGGIAVITRFTDRDKGQWLVTRAFRPGPAGAVDVSTTISCSRDRDILTVPMLGILPGAGTFGPHKHQALFAGLEYLDADEPSSSEKDIIGPGANRRVPDTAKITQPLMVVQNAGRYVGLIWKPSPRFCAVFDSPDRTFKSGGHLMGVLFPGSDGSNREEGSLLPYDPVHVKANTRITLNATIIGGTGNSVVPAVRQYVALNPPPGVRLPPLPLPEFAAGWLDSGIRQDGLFRHAYPGSFQPQPAADAAMWMDYLASLTTDPNVAGRLKTAASEAIARVPGDQYNTAGVGHVRYPAPALVFGQVLESVRTSLREGRETLARFDAAGTVLYRPDPGADDLGRTHFAKDANGLTSDAVARVLEAAEYTGNPDLQREGLRLLDALGKYANTAPRGAQTWEVPLHTPDILASAHLVKAYVLGYELSGRREYLDAARYWAWTGVPFVYLVPPVAKPVGLYGTIAVYGATHWTAPNWMGLPVQWCGLVYAAALKDLARYDSTGPWRQIVQGIVASGEQQVHPVGQDPLRQGLLPDSFNLRGQVRNDVAINPGTLLSVTPWAYGLAPVYSHNVFKNHLIVHAPGLISAVHEKVSGCSFRVHLWATGPCQVLVVGARSALSAEVNGKPAQAEYDPTLGALVVTVSGDATIDLKAG